MVAPVGVVPISKEIGPIVVSAETCCGGTDAREAAKVVHKAEDHALDEQWDEYPNGCEVERRLYQGLSTELSCEAERCYPCRREWRWFFGEPGLPYRALAGGPA